MGCNLVLINEKEEQIAITENHIMKMKFEDLKEQYDYTIERLLFFVENQPYQYPNKEFKENFKNISKKIDLLNESLRDLVGEIINKNELKNKIK